MGSNPQAPSAGAAPGTGTPGATPPTAPAAPLSDDAILGLGPEAPAAEPSAPAAVEPSQEPTPTVEPTAEAKPEPEEEIVEPLEEVVVPEDLKALFQQPGTGPKVRDMFWRLEAYKAVMPTVAEARELRQLFSSVDAAREAASDQEDFRKFDEHFYHDPGAFVRALHEEDKQQFAQVVRSLPDIYYELDPQGYQAHIAIPVVKDVLANLHARAAADGTETGQNLKRALDVISFRLFGKPFEQVEAAEALPDAQQTLLSRREQELQQKERSFEEQRFKQFHGGTNEAAVNQVFSLVKAATDKLLEGTAVGEAAKKRIIGDAYNRLDAAIHADRDLRHQLRREFRGGQFDDDHQRRIVSLLVNKAKTLIRPTVQKVVNEWTKDVLSLNRAHITKQEGAGAKPEITAGGTPSGATLAGNPLDPSKIDYGRTSDQDILDGKVVLRK